MSTPSEYVMFRSAIHSDQAFKKIGSATMVARSKWCKSFQKWLFLTIVLWRAPSSAAYSIHFTNSSLKALSCKEPGILSAIEKKIFGKNIICKTSEGATRSRTKSRGANPASRPSARTHIQTENSTLSNRVFFCIIILLRTLVSLPFLHTILLWYFFVLSWFFQRSGVLNLRVCAGRWFRKFSRFFDFWEVLGDASRGSLIFQCFGFFEFVCLFALGDASRGCRGSSIFHGFSILKTAATKPARTISLSSPRQSLDPWPLEHWKIKEPRQPGDHHPEQTNARIQKSPNTSKKSKCQANH